MLGMAECAERLNPPRCHSSCVRARKPSEPLRRSSLSCLHDNAGMTLVIPSIGCVSAKSSDRAPVCTGSSLSGQSVVLPQRQCPRARTAARLPGAPFSRLGPQNLFVFELLGHRIYSCSSSWGSLFAPWATESIRVRAPGASFSHLGLKFPLVSD